MVFLACVIIVGKTLFGHKEQEEKMSYRRLSDQSANIKTLSLVSHTAGWLCVFLDEPSSIVPGWITVRNTVGQALVGMQANKAGLVKVWDVKWQLTQWQSGWEAATRGWMKDDEGYIAIESAK